MGVYFNIICVTTKEIQEERMSLLSNGAMFKELYITKEQKCCINLSKDSSGATASDSDVPGVQLNKKIKMKKACIVHFHFCKTWQKSLCILLGVYGII